VRVWRLYLRAARNGFVKNFTSIYQVRCSLLPQRTAAQTGSSAHGGVAAPTVADMSTPARA
jgi:hypothetical protein